MEGEWFSLVFPEGRGFVGGWKILSGKLRSLGVSMTQRRVEKHKATVDPPFSPLAHSLLGALQVLLYPVVFPWWPIATACLPFPSHFGDFC